MPSPLPKPKPTPAAQPKATAPNPFPTPSQVPGFSKGYVPYPGEHSMSEKAPKGAVGNTLTEGWFAKGTTPSYVGNTDKFGNVPVAQKPPKDYKPYPNEVFFKPGNEPKNSGYVGTTLTEGYFPKGKTPNFDSPSNYKLGSQTYGTSVGTAKRTFGLPPSLAPKAASNMNGHKAVGVPNRAASRAQF